VNPELTLQFAGVLLALAFICGAFGYLVSRLEAAQRAQREFEAQQGYEANPERWLWRDHAQDGDK